jgi:RNA polymerase sigma-70 factor (ECF subfamily)
MPPAALPLVHAYFIRKTPNPIEFLTGILYTYRMLRGSACAFCGTQLSSAGGTCPQCLEARNLAQEQYEAGRRSFPGIRLLFGALLKKVLSVLGKHFPDYQAFFRESSKRLTEVLDFLKRLRWQELYLTTACAQKDGAAWECFQARYLPMLKKAAMSVAKNAMQAHEICSTVLSNLFLPSAATEDSEPKISQYDGIGSLEGWLRIILSRMVIDQHRAARRQISLDELDAEPATPPTLPGSAQLVEQDERKKAVKLFEEAFCTAINQLETQEKLVLRLYFLENVKMKQIGILIKAHESTACRLLEKVKKQLRLQVEKHLREKGRVNPREIWFYLEAGQSEASLELKRMLGVEKKLEH